MKVAHFEQIPNDDVKMEGANGCRMRCLIGPTTAPPASRCGSSRWPPAATRPNTPTPTSTRCSSWKARASCWIAAASTALPPGMAVYVAPDEIHQFRNTGSGPLEVPLPDPASAAEHVAPADAVRRWPAAVRLKDPNHVEGPRFRNRPAPRGNPPPRLSILRRGGPGDQRPRVRPAHGAAQEAGGRASRAGHARQPHAAHRRPAGRASCRRSSIACRCSRSKTPTASTS